MRAENMNTLALELSGALVLHLDAKGRIIDANEAAAQLLALEGEAISQNPAAGDFFGGDIRQVLSENMVRSGETVTHVAETTGVGGQRHYIEWRLKTIERDPSAPVLILAVGRDITGFVLNERYMLEERSNLVERNKELTCLYDIARISIAEMPLAGLIQCIVEQLPPAFQYPHLASARIQVDGRPYTTVGFGESQLHLNEKLIIHGRERGSIDIFYAAAGGTDGAEIGFLSEEQRLLRTIAHQAALMIEKKLSDDNRVELENQLRHADRLATIGQLTAGVAHELNEPLGSILGFAQLAANSKRLPTQVARDLAHIIQSALHAREIIKKLMLFSRQVPNRKAAVSLNRLIADGLSFIEPRFAKSDITFEKDFESGLPEISADPSQLTQVLVNLVVNAIQAMPNGGCLSIKTATVPEGVVLVIRDSGIGMDEAVLDQIFLPFYTTKEVDQGTGLGLSVVHGIVTAHGGKIEVHSQKGEGTRFEVMLPLRNGGEADDDGSV
jgi:two-component system, NtrC family, sensor kinase